MNVVDEYIARRSEAERQALQAIADTTRKLVPEAEEALSYSMPAFKYKGRPLVGFSVSAKHLSVFPFSPLVVEKVLPDIEGYSTSKGTIRFTADKPLPQAVVKAIITYRKQEIDTK